MIYRDKSFENYIYILKINLNERKEKNKEMTFLFKKNKAYFVFFVLFLLFLNLKFKTLNKL